MISLCPKLPSSGGGWYGCHIADILQTRGFKVLLLEKAGHLFAGASGKNQFRLHAGFHYPRSSITRSQIRGQLYGDCFDIACSWFRRLGRSAHEKGVTIGIEANAKEYGCDFCFTTSQAAELVRVIDCPGVKLLLDTANMHLANDDVDSCIVSNKDIICHVQVSEPGLTNFESPVVNHAAVAKALVQIGYDGTLSIEMREDDRCLKTISALACA